jgi:uncharacterized cupin superfamily protein
MPEASNVVREDDLKWGEQSHSGRFGHRRKQLGSAAGAEKLGCSLYEIPPGRQAWPYHYHLANEEAIYVLEGSGSLRIDGEQVEISRGDYVVLPVGPTGAHQVTGSSDAPLRYLCLSTMVEPDGCSRLSGLEQGGALRRSCARRRQRQEDPAQVPPGRGGGGLLRR